MHEDRRGGDARRVGILTPTGQLWRRPSSACPVGDAFGVGTGGLDGSMAGPERMPPSSVRSDGAEQRTGL